MHRPALVQENDSAQQTLLDQEMIRNSHGTWLLATCPDTQEIDWIPLHPRQACAS